MDRQLLERMIGAVVLIGLLVIVAPALLDGGREGDAEQEPAAAPEPGESGLRTHTIRLDEEADSPPIARELAPEAEQQPAAVVGPPVAPEQPAPPPVVRAPPVPEAPEPVRDDDADKVAEPPPSNPAPEVKVAASQEGWAVQLGSFSQRDNAQRLAAEVEEKGFAAFLMPLEKEGATLYRVRVGPRPDRGEAEKLAAKLAAAGYMGRPVPQNPDS